MRRTRVQVPCEDRFGTLTEGGKTFWVRSFSSGDPNVILSCLTCSTMHTASFVIAKLTGPTPRQAILLCIQLQYHRGSGRIYIEQPGETHTSNWLASSLVRSPNSWYRRLNPLGGRPSRGVPMKVERPWGSEPEFFNFLSTPGIYSKESIPPAYVAWVGNLSPAMGRGINSRNRVWNWIAKLNRMAGRYGNPMPTWFLAPHRGT